MLRRNLAALAAILLLTPLSAQAPRRATTPNRAATPARPKLILMIVVDQMRADYLWRYGSQFRAGLKRLTTQGAMFTNAFYEHAHTVTAVGHSTTLSGATPSVSGIIGNDWYDRASGRMVTSVFDPNSKAVGANGSGASPRRLLVSTLGDELKMSHRGTSKNIGISMKDRSAILPAGHMADAAYWFDGFNGNFISSDYYMNQLPEWVVKHNATRPGDRYAGKDWVDAKGNVLSKVPASGSALYDALPYTPYGNDIVVEFAKAAIDNEQLGAHENTDVLAVSLSSNDYVGHKYGPDSPQVDDVSIRTDQQLGELLDYVDKKVGLRNTLVALTADHGVGPVPEENIARKMPGGRVVVANVRQAVGKALIERFGEGTWIEERAVGTNLYLNHTSIDKAKLDLCEVQKVAAKAMRAQDGIYRVYTGCELSMMSGGDMVDERVRRGYHRERGPDLYVLVKPYWLEGSIKASHGLPYNYDAHVPLILMGPGIKAGKYHGKVAVNDLAPTLATLLEVEIPSGASGRVLTEALQ